MVEVLMTAAAIARAAFQSNDHHQNPTFSGWMPFLSPNQQYQSTEGKNITFHGLTYLKLTCGLPTLSLITNSSWLPWGRVAMPLIKLCDCWAGRHVGQSARPKSLKVATTEPQGQGLVLKAKATASRSRSRSWTLRLRPEPQGQGQGLEPQG